jgi:hypothetical protein
MDFDQMSPIILAEVALFIVAVPSCMQLPTLRGAFGDLGFQNSVAKTP